MTHAVIGSTSAGRSVERDPISFPSVAASAAGSLLEEAAIINTDRILQPGRGRGLRLSLAVVIMTTCELRPSSAPGN